MCRDIMDFSQGKQKVKSSGIMEFGVSRDQYEPNVFYTWERYDSNGSLGRHNTSPEFQAFMENVSTLTYVQPEQAQSDSDVLQGIKSCQARRREPCCGHDTHRMTGSATGSCCGRAPLKPTQGRFFALTDSDPLGGTHRHGPLRVEGWTDRPTRHPRR